jgi:hypothetical protein
MWNTTFQNQVRPAMTSILDYLAELGDFHLAQSGDKTTTSRLEIRPLQKNNP